MVQLHSLGGAFEVQLVAQSVPPILKLLLPLRKLPGIYLWTFLLLDNTVLLCNWCCIARGGSGLTLKTAWMYQNDDSFKTNL